MVILILLILVGIVGGILYALIREIISFIQGIDTTFECFIRIVQNLSANLRGLSEPLPFDLEEMLNYAVENIMSWIYAESLTIAESAVVYTMMGFTGIGNFVVSFIFFLMASYFTMSRFPEIKKGLHNAVGPQVYARLSSFRKIISKALGGYIRVQLTMASIISVFSLIVFLITGQPYALLLSLLFFVLDLMPLIGVGLVLVPWGLFTLFFGEIWFGLVLLSMYAVVFMLHRLLEPKIMGRHMGLPPLIALLSLYLGIQFGGILGLILGPMIATIIVSFYKAGLFKGTISDFKAVLNLYGKKT
jgi:sporulation integral membrane protein YtvI